MSLLCFGIGYAKYGYPQDAAGKVSIILHELDGTLCLEVSDDGIGLTDEQRDSGVGMKLIRALAKQLGGAAEWHGPPGTLLVVRFPAGPVHD